MIEARGWETKGEDELDEVVDEVGEERALGWGERAFWGV